MGTNKIGNFNVGPIKLPDKPVAQNDKKAKSGDFKTQLDNSLKNLEDLKFSGHALERLSSRGVDLSGAKTERLLNAVKTAEQKGSNESLVLLDELAFVVSIKNRTVITACDTNGLKEGVFTKIDSAIFG